MRALVVLALLLAPVTGPVARLDAQQIRDLASHSGEVPVRLVGYGLVVGLDGTGDRSHGTNSGTVMTVQSVVNLLRRFNIEVPPDRMRLRNVAAVLVTSVVSPWLRPGGQFEVQVASLGDATSLRGGVLWTTPLLTGPETPPVATAQGPVLVEDASPRGGTFGSRRGNSARIPDGGSLEFPLPELPTTPLGLVLRRPDLVTADRIARIVQATYGEGVAEVADPGLVRLKPDSADAENTLRFLASVDTLPVDAPIPPSIVIDARSGLVVTGGEIRIGPATVAIGGLTVRVGAPTRPEGEARPEGVVDVASGASAHDVLAGLHAAGATGEEIISVFEALTALGALRARIQIR